MGTEGGITTGDDDDVLIADSDIDGEAGVPPIQAQAQGGASGEPYTISETNGYFLISYPPDTPSDERLSFSEGALLREFNQLVLGMPAGKDYPLLEGNVCKFKPGNYPPVTIHGYDYDLATDICNYYEFVTLQVGDKQSTLQIRAKRTMFASMFEAAESRGPSFFPTMRSHLAAAGGWIEVPLTDQQIDLGINIRDVVAATEAIGLKVYRRVHVQAKILDEESNKLLPLGTEFPTHRFNLTVKPLSGDMGSFDWSKYPSIPLSKCVNWRGEVKTISTSLLYTVGGELLKDREGKPLLCILREGGGCKRPNSICKGACRLAEKAKRLENRDWGSKRSEHGSSKAAAKAVKQARRDEYVNKTQAAKSLLKTALPHSDSRCEYVLAGKCSMGSRCKKDHTFAGDASVLAQISSAR